MLMQSGNNDANRAKVVTPISDEYLKIGDLIGNTEIFNDCVFIKVNDALKQDLRAIVRQWDLDDESEHRDATLRLAAKEGDFTVH